MKKVISIVMVAVMAVTGIAVIGGTVNAASKAEKAYHKFVKKGYYSIRKVKGSKTPVLFYAKKAERQASFIDADGKKYYSGKKKYFSNSHKLYTFRKGKVRKVDTADLLKVKTDNALALSLSKGRIFRQGVKQFDVLHISGDKLNGVRYDLSKFDFGDNTVIYRQTIKGSVVQDDKRMVTENEAQAAVGLLLNEGGKPLYLKKVGR